MAKSYVVTAAGLVAKMSNDTGEGYLYRGDIVPAAVKAAERDRLIELGLVEEVEVVEVEVSVTPVGDGQGSTPDPAGGSKPVEEMSLVEAREYAGTKGIDVAGLTKVGDVRKAITDAQAAKA